MLFRSLSHNCRNFLITTANGSHDASGKMNRTHRAMTLLSKKNIVEFVENKRLFYVDQTIWKVNLKKYHQALIKFDKTRSELNVCGYTDEYNYIKNNGFILK